MGGHARVGLQLPATNPPQNIIRNNIWVHLAPFPNVLLDADQTVRRRKQINSFKTYNIFWELKKGVKIQTRYMFEKPEITPLPQQFKSLLIKIKKRLHKMGFIIHPFFQSNVDTRNPTLLGDRNPSKKIPRVCRRGWLNWLPKRLLRNDFSIQNQRASQAQSFWGSPVGWKSTTSKLVVYPMIATFTFRFTGFWFIEIAKNPLKIVHFTLTEFIHIFLGIYISGEFASGSEPAWFTFHLYRI